MESNIERFIDKEDPSRIEMNVMYSLTFDLYILSRKGFIHHVAIGKQYGGWGI